MARHGTSVMSPCHATNGVAARGVVVSRSAPERPRILSPELPRVDRESACSGGVQTPGHQWGPCAAFPLVRAPYLSGWRDLNPRPLRPERSSRIFWSGPGRVSNAQECLGLDRLNTTRPMLLSLTSSLTSPDRARRIDVGCSPPASPRWPCSGNDSWPCLQGQLVTRSA
jgi:hypothetical protein